MHNLQLALDLINDLSEEALKILLYLQKKHLDGSFYFFGNLADLESISAILSKADSTTDFFSYGTCNFFLISDIYLQEIFTILYQWRAYENI